MTHAWTWSYEGYDPDTERLRETLCTLGNGYFATRGAACEVLSGPAHYPGTYAAGCYNRLLSTVAGRPVENEDMVNLPNWLPLRYRICPADAAPGPWLSPDHAHLTEHRQTLDLRHGTLTRWSVYEDEAGRRLTVEQCRLVHMGEPHLAALRTCFASHGWTGAVEVEAGIDGAVRNAGVARYRGLADQHLTGWETGTGQPDTVWLSCRTLDSDIRIALAARTRVPGGHGGVPRPQLTALRAFHTLILPLTPDSPAVVDKTVALYTSRDPAIESPLHTAVDAVALAPHFRQLRAAHRRAWENLWRQAKLEVPGESGRILRLHLFHVLQTLSPHTAELDVGVPARGLHGEAYRGHVFW
ncbi:glycoside hydrolase family 65 protein, partial [Streptomyces nigrescens]